MCYTYFQSSNRDHKATRASNTHTGTRTQRHSHSNSSSSNHIATHVKKESRERSHLMLQNQTFCVYYLAREEAAACYVGLFTQPFHLVAIHRRDVMHQRSHGMTIEYGGFRSIARAGLLLQRERGEGYSGCLMNGCEFFFDTPQTPISRLAILYPTQLRVPPRWVVPRSLAKFRWE